MSEKLSKEELDVLTSLLKRVTPLPKMEWPILRTIWENRLMPMNPIELFILDRPVLSADEGNLRILLSWRGKDDPYYPNCWHHPGGYLGADERIEAAIQRAAQREIGVPVKNISPVTMANWPKIARDHQWSLLVTCQPDGEPILKKGKLEYFPFNKQPSELLPYHVLMHEKVKSWIQFVRCLQGQDPDLCQMFLNSISPVLESDLKK